VDSGEKMRKRKEVKNESCPAIRKNLEAVKVLPLVKANSEMPVEIPKVSFSTGCHEDGRISRSAS